MKIFRRTAAALTALVLSAGSLPYAVLSAEAYSKADIVAAVHANDIERDRIDSMTSYLYNGTDEILSFTFNNDPVLGDLELPEKYDLRDVDGKNYVSPVKLQNPWGTCWSFGGTAAVETSYASATGFDYNDPANEWLLSLHDFSEKHLAWFTFTPLTDKSGKYLSQVGEGYHGDFNEESDPADISNKVYFHGGFYSSANTLYSAGIGPALESDFPYENNKEVQSITELFAVGFTISDDPATSDESRVLLFDEVVNKEDVQSIVDELEKKYPDYEFCLDTYVADKLDHPTEDVIGKKLAAVLMSDVVDWTIDDSKRFSSAYYLKDGNVLPAPFTTGEKGEYVYNPVSNQAIKSEIVNGRGVAIAFCADQSMPGQSIGKDSYMNFIDKDGEHTNSPDDAVIWAQYSYDRTYDPADAESVNKPVAANHAVCIVGYDDNFPKEYFNDPNGTIGGNGAWIVKNSWGSTDTGWGSGKTGYFYLSYYDQGLCFPESYVLDTDSETKFLLKDIDMYDFLPTIGRNRITMEDEICMANIFTAQSNSTVRFIGVDVTSAESDVEYSIYKLNDKAVSPVDGELFSQSKEHFTYSGYHMIDLGRSMPLRKGDKYSVAVKIKDPDGYQLNVSRELNKQGIEFYEPYAHQRYLDSGEDPAKYEPRKDYGVGIVNKGESFVGSGNDWSDWADVITELKTLNKDMNNDGFDYDNFAVRSYPETEFLSVKNKPVDVQETYKAGDVLKGVVKVSYNAENSPLVEDFGGNFEIELTINGKQLMIGENNANAVFNKLAKGETLEIPYEYTVTEDDVKLGSVESTARLKFMSVYLDEERKPIFPEDLSFAVQTEADAPESSAPENDSSSESTPDSSSGSKTDSSKAASNDSNANPKTGAAAAAGVLLVSAAAAAVAVRKKH